MSVRVRYWQYLLKQLNSKMAEKQQLNIIIGKKQRLIFYGNKRL